MTCKYEFQRTTSFFPIISEATDDTKKRSQTCDVKGSHEGYSENNWQQSLLIKKHFAIVYFGICTVGYIDLITNKK